MNLETYRQWLGMARKFSTRADEAEDLLQDCLLIAIRQGRHDLGAEENRRWLTGVLKKRAAQRARDAVRQKEREHGAAEPVPPPEDMDGNGDGSFLLRRLPPASRKVATLVLHGLNREEIRYALSLSETAFRQRLTAIRKAIGSLPEPLKRDALAQAYRRHTGDAHELALGLIRRALLARLKDAPGIGTHDLDGHLLVFEKKKK